MRKVLSIYTVALAAGLSSSLPAGGVNKSYPDSSATLLPVLEVSSDRNRERKSSAPSQRLDAKGMLTGGVTDISDALHRFAGITLRDYGGAGGLKTLSVRGLGAQHTGVIYDGVSLNDTQTGQIDLSRYSLANLSSMELNIGGNDDILAAARQLASAATLSINTLRTPDMLSDRPEMTASISGGSFGMISPYLRVAASNAEDLAFSAAANFFSSKNDFPFTLRNGSATSREKRQNAALSNLNTELNGIWKPNAAASLSAKIYYYDSKQELPGPVIYYASPSDQNLRQRNFFTQLNYRAPLSSRFSISALGKFNWSSYRYTDKGGKYPGGELNQYYLQNEEYLAAALSYRPANVIELAYAADYFHNSLSSNLTSGNHPRRNSLLQSLTARLSLWRMTLTGRLLHSLAEDRSEDHRKTRTRFSPAISLRVKPLENAEWYLRASYKNIFRLPSFNELYFDHYGSINLDPELTDQYNLGTTLTLPSRGILSHLSLTLDGYINRVRNKIVAIPYNMFVMTMTNLGRVHIAGLDVTLSAGFDLGREQRLILTGNYSYQRAEPHTSPQLADWKKQLAYTPLNSGAASVTWENPWVSLVIHSSGQSARYTTNSNLPSTRIEGYMEAGVTLYHDFRLSGSIFQIRADLINALDKQYQLVARYPMPGRSWAVTLKFTY